MAEMTWRQFVAHVEKEMEKEGISPDTEIGVIDFSYPSVDHPPMPFIEGNCGLWMFGG